MKIIFQSIFIALDGLRTHKLRSFLTMLGIICGVTAVVAMQAIGKGAEEEILNKISVMGIDNIYIYDDLKIRQEHIAKGGQYISSGLNKSDFNSFKNIIAEYTSIVPVIDKNFFYSFRNKRGDLKVVATTAEYFSVLNLELKLGRFFNQFDIENKNKVAIIGGGLFNKLRRTGKVLNHQIKIKDEWFSIVGIMESKATVTKKDDNMDYEDFNFNIYIPFGNKIVSSSDRDFASQISRYIINCIDKSYVGKIGIIVERILLRNHNALRDFKIVIPEELLKQHQETQRIFNLVLICIAAISLLVGGIGIMNIMLASILERTKEIGIRRAIGAKKINIRLQFFCEAVLLTVIGGMIGLLVAIIISNLLTVFWEMPTKITLLPCLLSFSISALVGVVFGFFPAKKAADMNPIDALRYE